MRKESVTILYCKQCAWRAMGDAIDFVSIGLWPASAEAVTFFDFSYMLHMSVLQNLSPGLSMGSMLEALKFITSFDKQVCTLTHYFVDGHSPC